MLREAGSFRATHLLIEHPGSGMLPPSTFAALRELVPRFLVDEGDLYDPFRKRFPASLRAAARLSDLVLLPGISRQAQWYRAMGARRIEWLPSGFNPHDFGSAAITGTREFDVVMIANDSRSRIPGWSMPGSARRVKLAEALMRRFGGRFALHGDGWPASYGATPIPFLDQEKSLLRAKVSVNFDHYPSESRSFSNRLPIALASGSVHVTSSHPGYDEIFPTAATARFFAHARPVSQIIDRVDALLEQLDSASLVERGLEARRFAHARFREDDLLVRALRLGGAQIREDDAKRAWALPVESMSMW